ncbi:MAG: hypothetical protein KatS3mg108_3445 [Isosphaeraceae bacterium]|jgi:hypothetical protein|nr:MAG: hypothetical protein KatS3mg108_3445 [Isosphaeraceae bacterium]
MTTFTLVAAALLGHPGIDESPPAIRIVAAQPAEQLVRILSLFDQTPVSSPAEWLARWRAATANPDLLSKAAQALIAALNPEMIPEAAILDGATFQLETSAEGSLVWSLLIPDDDGSYAALATAMALTDGAAEPALASGIPVDRLDPNGRILTARSGPRLAFASSRDALERALLLPDPSKLNGPPGLLLHLEPAQLASATLDPLARLGRSLREAGVAVIDARLVLEADALACEIRATRSGRTPSSALDPAWLAALPADAPLAFSLTLDTDAIDLLTGLAAGLLPEASSSPRARFAALALATGVVPEVELWPNLRGLSGYLQLDARGQPQAGCLLLHARDERAAQRLADRVLPRLAQPFRSRLRNLGAPLPPPRAGANQGLRAAEFNAFGIEHQGADVRLTWGVQAGAFTGRSLHESTQLPDLTGLDHLIVFQPSPLLLALGLGPESPAAIAARTAPPVLIYGRRQPDALISSARWIGLSQTVGRLVAATPQRPADEPLP